MSSLGIFVLGIFVTLFTGFGAFLIGLQENEDRRQRGNTDEQPSSPSNVS